MSERHKNTKSCDFEIILAFVMVIHNHKKREIDLILFMVTKIHVIIILSRHIPAGKITRILQGIPGDGGSLVEGESPEKFGL